MTINTLITIAIHKKKNMDRRRLSVFAKFVGYSDGTEYDNQINVSTTSI